MSFVVVIVLSQGGVKCIVDHEDLDLDCPHAHRDGPCVPRRLPRVLREERRRLVQVSESTRIMSVSDMQVVRQR